MGSKGEWLVLPERSKCLFMTNSGTWKAEKPFQEDHPSTQPEQLAMFSKTKESMEEFHTLGALEMTRKEKS